MATQWLGAMDPPPGVDPNFVDPPDQMRGNVALHAVLLSVVTITVAMRLYTRSFITKSSLGIDDYFCFISYFLTVIFSGLMIKSYTEGIGRHVWDVLPSKLPRALKLFTFADYAYLTLAATIKLSLLFFYLRVFTQKTKSRYFIIFGIVFVSLTNTGLVLATIFGCTPVARAWNAMLPGHCIDPTILSYLSGALNSTTDIYTLVVPLRLLWGLDKRLRYKLKIVAAFCLGIFACVTSLIRLVKTHILRTSFDTTWNISKITIWALLEVNVGIICGCLLLLPAFLDRHWPKAFSSYFSRLWSYTTTSVRRKPSDSSMSLNQYVHL